MLIRNLATAKWPCTKTSTEHFTPYDVNSLLHALFVQMFGGI